MKADRFLSITRPRFLTWALIALSIAICIWYYSSIGYLALFEGFRSSASGSGADVAGLRLASYTGADYLYPGYVNQFKNTLLPALTTIVVTYMYMYRIAHRFVIALPLVGLSVLFILGTGQRGAFVTFAIALVLYVKYVNPAAFPKRLLVLVAVGLPLFLASTFALGRSSAQLASAAGTGGQLVVLLQEVVFRIFGSNQVSAIAGFRYIYQLPNQAGADWLLSFRGLLPGVSGSTLDNEIFASLYASDRGNAPPSLWGSLYYNFGFVGALAVAAILAVLLVFVARMGEHAGRRSTLELVGYAGIVTVLGTWVAGTPVTFLNGGLLVYVALYLVGRRGSAEMAASSEVHNLGRDSLVDARLSRMPPRTHARNGQPKR